MFCTKIYQFSVFIFHNQRFDAENIFYRWILCGEILSRLVSKQVRRVNAYYLMLCLYFTQRAMGRILEMCSANKVRVFLCATLGVPC